MVKLGWIIQRAEVLSEMSIREEILEELGDLGIVDCCINDDGAIAFAAQDWTDFDSLEPRTTTLYFNFPSRKKEDQWASRGQNKVTGIFGCACKMPEERWVFVTEPGEVYVIGGGVDGYESPITGEPRSYFSQVKCISGGYAYAVGLRRKVFRRIAPNKWQDLGGKELIPKKKQKDIGFRDIDGFSDDELYACGGKGDLWYFDGHRWHDGHVPTDAVLKRILCASNGRVIVITNRQEILCGKESSWDVIECEIGSEIFQEIIEYNSKVYVSTDFNVYELQGSEITSTSLKLPKMKTYTHLAANGVTMIVAGSNEAFRLEKNVWHKIF